MRSTRVTSVALVRPRTARFAFWGMIGASAGLLVFGKMHNDWVERSRMTLAEAAAPVVQAIAKPLDSMQQLGQWVADMAALKAENDRLKNDNARLLRWQSAATELGSENERLRALLKFAPAKASSYISARVAVDGASPYSRSVLITAGEAEGLGHDAPVVNESGFVGRVVEVGKTSSRVLLVTDINSRVPVVAEHSREKAIAGGTGGESLSLMYLPEQSKIKVGEAIVTSGDGGVMPPGLPVGVVTKVENGAVTVQPVVDFYRLEYVSIVDFE